MSRAINMLVYIYLSWAIALLLSGCILNSAVGSGYAVDIGVVETQNVGTKDVTMLKDIAAKEKFVQRQMSPPDKRECLYFGRDLENSRFQHLRYKFIVLGCCFTKEDSSSGNKALRDLRVIIYNDWEGQDPPIKQEIDRLGDVFYRELATRFGKENVKIERRRTAPPF